MTQNLPKAYITIDDSPSDKMNILVDFLLKEEIPTMFFCRGDLLEQNEDQALYAIQKGFKLGNHSYSHRPAGEIGVKAVIEEIEKTEDMLARLYSKAGHKNYDKHFRFPYLDRGDGDKVEQRFPALINRVEAGEKITSLYDHEDKEEVIILQNYLKEKGYTQPFKEVNHPLYKIDEIAEARDCILTFTSCDWALKETHIGKKGFNNVEDLKKFMALDPWFLKENHCGIALFHDNCQIIDVTIELMRYMKATNLKFMCY